MGEMADYYRDLNIDEEILRAECYEGNSYYNMIWTNKDGKKFLIRKMGDSHIQNLERFMRKHNNTENIRYERVLEELQKRNLDIYGNGCVNWKEVE